MSDPISTIGSILTIIEKIHSFVKWSKTKHEKVNEKKLEESRELLNDISKLIDSFSESVDIILDCLEKIHELSYYIGNSLGKAKLFKANRRLFELSNDMEVIALSISKRLPYVEAQEIQKISDYCLQITVLEVALSVVLARKSNFNILPVEPSLINSYRLARNGISEHHWYSRYFPNIMTDSKENYGYSYFNSMLLELARCKKELAIAIQDLS